MRQTKTHFGLILDRASRFGDKKRGRRGRRGRRRRRRRTKVCFLVLESCGFWISKVFGMNFPWRLVAHCSKVLGRDHINPRILEVLGEKP